MSVLTIAQRTDTTVPLTLTVNRNGGIAGLSPLLAIRDGSTLISYLDFADNTFKIAGHTTRQITLSDLSATAGAGFYAKPSGLNISVITNLPATSTHLVAEYEITTAPNKGVSQDVIVLMNGYGDIPGGVWEELLAAHVTPGTFGEKVNSAGGLTAADITTILNANPRLRIIEEILRNELHADPADGKLKIFDGQGNVILEGALFEDIAKLIPYRGRGQAVRERLDTP